jgi:mannosyltransferase OCH1-like enzyme
MNDHELLLTGRGAHGFRFPGSPLLESELEIPKTLHMVWIGGRIPTRYALHAFDFAEHNPDWDVILWDDERVALEVEHMRNRDLYLSETNPAAKVDLLRYELIHQFGGVYLDADTRSLGPGSLDPMTHAFLTVSGDPWFNTGNAQFGFAKGSEFLAYVIENARDPRVRGMREIPDRTGPTFLTTCALSFDDWRIIHPNGKELLAKVHHLAEKNW